MSKNSTITRPKFGSEKEEADWYHTPEGHAYSLQSLKKAAREGRLRFRNGTTGKPPTAAEVKQLLEQARAQLLKPVNLRLPQGDLDAAKRLAEKTGKGYQTILKEIIHEGLQRAS
jgi:hypothetical protein